MSLPEFSTTSLNKTTLSFPKQCINGCLIVFGFAKDHDEPMEQIVNQLQQTLVSNNITLKIYEIPLIGKQPKWIQGFIFKAMKKGSAPDRFNYISPFFDDYDPITKSLDINDFKNPVTIMINKDGKVFMKHVGLNPTLSPSWMDSLQIATQSQESKELTDQKNQNTN